jgi:hypothetical protein
MIVGVLTDETFVSLTRKVYITKDKQAALKKQINIKHQLTFIQEKSYAGY